VTAALFRAWREKGFVYAVAIPFAVILGFPFVWMGVTTLKSQAQVFDPKHTWSFHPTLASFGFLLHHTKYLRWVENTCFVGLLVVAITLAVAVPAGYALARLSGRVGQSMGVAIFLTYLVPPTLLFLPLSRVISTLHLQDRLWALVLVYPSFTIPFAIWLLMGFFKTIPQELEDAALVDGCSRLSTIVRVVFPISVPGILTVVIFTFSLVVNEFVYAITFISSSANRTLSVGVPTDLIRADLYDWPGIMAAILLPSIPLALVYNAFLDRFIAGFTGGAFR
jgi:multiple sugar transport system permease protein